MSSGRLVAATTKTFFLASRPSISVSSWFTWCMKQGGTGAAAAAIVRAKTHRVSHGCIKPAHPPPRTCRQGAQLCRVYPTAFCVKFVAGDRAFQIKRSTRARVGSVPYENRGPGETAKHVSMKPCLEMVGPSKLTTRSLTPPPSPPPPRFGHRASSSSKKMMQGDDALALWNTWRTDFSDSPTYLSRSSGPEQ